MLPKNHIIAGVVISIAIYSIFHITLFQTLTIFFSSFLIDFDHYLSYSLKTKDFSLKRAEDYFYNKKKRTIKMTPREKNQFKTPLLIFHGFEFWIILFLLSYPHIIFLFILLGVSIHMIMDFIEIIYLKEPFYSKFSQLYVLYKNKTKKRFYNNRFLS